MSVAEKLGALGVETDKGWDSGPYDIDEQNRQDELLAALPQIVAVVEAAERAEYEYELCRQGADDGEFALWSEERLYTALHAIRPALAALDEKLAVEVEQHIGAEHPPGAEQTQ